MAIPVPFSRAFVLLLLALPGAWLLGRAASRRISNDRGARAVLAAGLALSLAVLAVHAASLAAGSLRVGLPIGLLATAAAGVAAEITHRRRALRARTAPTNRTNSSAPSDHADRPEGRPPSSWMFLTMIAATAAMTPVALGYHLHDELYLTGHMSVAAEIQNGVYPPRHLAFADTPLRYHYGFDMVTAAVTALLRVPVDRAIDLATLALFALSWCLFWALGERLLGRARAWLVPVGALLAGGVPVACDNPQRTLVGRVVDMCQIGPHYVNPPVPAYFFQHPWSIGIPVGLTALLLATSRRAPSERVRLAALTAVLAALSISQMTLFAAFLPAFVVAEALREGTFDRARALRMLAVAAASLLLAKLLGGFFVSVPGLPGLPFVAQLGFGRTLRETALWNAQTFGALLPLGLAGFFLLRRDRLLFGLLAAGSLLVVNTLRYEGTDDILKFATLASLSLAVLASAPLARCFPDRTTQRPPVAPWKTTAALALLASTTLSGAVFLWALDTGWPGIPAWMRSRPSPVTPADAEVITRLREQIRPGEAVYRNTAATHAYAQWGGLPQPWIHWTAKAFGFPPDRIAARERLFQTAPAPPETYLREGFRYFVLDRSREDRPLRDAAEQWLTQGKARRLQGTDQLLVIDLAPPAH